jgi:hypothetical protein
MNIWAHRFWNFADGLSRYVWTAWVFTLSLSICLVIVGTLLSRWRWGLVVFAITTTWTLTFLTKWAVKKYPADEKILHRVWLFCVWAIFALALALV